MKSLSLFETVTFICPNSLCLLGTFGRIILHIMFGIPRLQILIGESSAPVGSDPIAMMEYYMKKAAQEEKLRPPKHSKDEMPPPASLQG